jgi:hypothetical protein
MAAFLVLVGIIVLGFVVGPWISLAFVLIFLGVMAAASE